MRRLVFFFAVLPALAAVEGIVRNETTGRPQAGATVSLFRFTQAGPEAVESVKSGGDGSWKIDQPLQTGGFIQTAYDGVTYNHMLRPGTPLTGIQIAVFQASATRSKEITVTNHMLLLEPKGDRLNVRESYFFENAGRNTWNDPVNGTLRFHLAAEPIAPVEINATAPQGMPIRRAAEKSGKPGEMKLDFPIKPGETRIDLAYNLPYSSPSKFKTRFLLPAMQTMIAVPNGATLKGDGIKDEGKEPTTQASIFRVDKNDIDLTLEGTGDLSGPGGEPESRGPEIEQIEARSYDKRTLLVIATLVVLAMGFALLYRSAATGDGAKAKEARK